MTATRLACRFMATLELGHLVHDSPVVAAGDEDRPLAEILPSLPVALSHAPRNSDAGLMSTIATAERDGMAFVYVASGVMLGHNFPLLVEHEDPPLAHGIHVTRNHLWLTFDGWVDPVHRAALSQLRHVSPGLTIDAAEIMQLASPVLWVQRFTVRELSALDAPAHPNTSFHIAPPGPVPAAELHRVLWSDGATYPDPAEESFSESETFRIAFDGPVTAF